MLKEYHTLHSQPVGRLIQQKFRQDVGFENDEATLGGVRSLKTCSVFGCFNTRQTEERTDLLFRTTLKQRGAVEVAFSSN